MTDGIFVMGKVYCNVTLDCFCSQPIGTLVGVNRTLYWDENLTDVTLKFQYISRPPIIYKK